jgi:hypothetical protein
LPEYPRREEKCKNGQGTATDKTPKANAGFKALDGQGKSDIATASAKRTDTGVRFTANLV